MELSTVWSPGAQRSTKPLVVALHGLGSNEFDLAELAQFWPEYDQVSLRAPLPYGPGFSWYPLALPANPEPAEVRAAGQLVVDWLAQHIEPSRPLVLLGFSQGGSVSLEVARIAPHALAGVVLLSGFVARAANPDLPDDDGALKARNLPVFWGYDPFDPVIPPEAIEHTAEWLPRHSDLTRVTYEFLGHSVSAQELQDVRGFLQSLVEEN